MGSFDHKRSWLLVIVVAVAACGQPIGHPTTVDIRGDAGVPSPRTGASAAYDDTEGTLVLFGGADRTGPLSETWTWDGKTWRR
jgi:hypothetical protein